MFRKIYILSFVLTFFISTTGLPLTLHICKMMEDATIEECGMCEHAELPETMPCCEADNIADEIITSGKFSDCCNTQIIDNKVEDAFLYLKEEVKNDQSSTVVVLPVNLFEDDSQTVKTFTPYASDSSPPSRENNLYKINSVLLN